MEVYRTIYIPKNRHGIVDTSTLQQMVKLKLLVLACLTDVLSYSWMTCPVSFNSDPNRKPELNGPCESVDTMGLSPTILQAGDRLKVGWVSNNEGGGFVRLALVPLSSRYDASAFDENVVKVTCFGYDERSGHYGSGFCSHPCNARGGCSYQTSKEDVNRYDTTIAIPTNLDDGEYVLQWKSISADNERPSYSCSLLQIVGGNKTQGPCKAAKLSEPTCVTVSDGMTAQSFLKDSEMGPFCYDEAGSTNVDVSMGKLVKNYMCDPRQSCKISISQASCQKELKIVPPNPSNLFVQCPAIEAKNETGSNDAGSPMKEQTNGTNVPKAQEKQEKATIDTLTPQKEQEKTIAGSLAPQKEQKQANADVLILQKQISNDPSASQRQTATGESTSQKEQKQSTVTDALMSQQTIASSPMSQKQTTVIATVPSSQKEQKQSTTTDALMSQQTIASSPMSQKQTIVTATVPSSQEQVTAVVSAPKKGMLAMENVEISRPLWRISRGKLPSRPTANPSITSPIIATGSIVHGKFCSAPSNQFFCANYYSVAMCVLNSWVVQGCPIGAFCSNGVCVTKHPFLSSLKDPLDLPAPTTKPKTLTSFVIPTAYAPFTGKPTMTASASTSTPRIIPYGACNHPDSKFFCYTDTQLARCVFNEWLIQKCARGTTCINGMCKLARRMQLEKESGVMRVRRGRKQRRRAPQRH